MNSPSIIATPTLEAAYQLQQEIARKRKELRELEETHRFVLDTLIERGQTRDGPYEIITREKSRRTLDMDAFKAAYPEIFVEYATVPLKVADDLLGKRTVSALCKVETTKTREIIYIPPGQKARL